MSQYTVLQEEGITSQHSDPLSDQDLNRSEEPWHTNTENLLNRWRENCQMASQAHEIAGKRCKRLGFTWTIPSAVLPAIAAPLIVTSHVYADTFIAHTIEAGVLVLSGVCGVINSTFQYSAQSEKHFAFAARYYDLITDIDLELSKRRAFRTQADVFLTKIHMTFDALNNAAPHL